MRLIAGGRLSRTYHRANVSVIEADDPEKLLVELEDRKRITVDERDCETLIPDRDRKVMVVQSGALQGRIGRLIDKDHDRQRVQVRLDGQVHSLHYDDCCELA